MKFGVIINRKMIDRGSSDPYGKLFNYLNEMEDLGYDLGWCGHHRFSSSTAFGGEEATEPSAPLPMLSALMARTSRMKFCTNIFLAPARHPLELARASATSPTNSRIAAGTSGLAPSASRRCSRSFRWP
jgi:alkanesulfonate monooxygenase SsuD/methylene tetrahydromethanopterin reductase-like flavin-dependent oxidoreductase (luciferase family)